MSETALEKAQKKFEQAKNRLDALKARESVRDRKLETRRKVVVGAAMIDLASRDEAAAAMLARIVASLTRQQDRSLFRDLTFAVSGDPQPAD
jgi:hypothetical protein